MVVRKLGVARVDGTQFLRLRIIDDKSVSVPMYTSLRGDSARTGLLGGCLRHPPRRSWK